MGRQRIEVKACPRCGVVKPRELFGEKSNGYIRDRCRTCAAELAREWRTANPEKRLEQKRRGNARNRASRIAAAAAWGKTERGRLVGRTHQAVQRALKKGILVRPSSCEWCGRDCKPTAAHSDYTKPLDVRWLCRFCHSRWDYEQPKTISA